MSRTSATYLRFCQPVHARGVRMVAHVHCVRDFFQGGAQAVRVCRVFLLFFLGVLLFRLFQISGG